MTKQTIKKLFIALIVIILFIFIRMSSIGSYFTFDSLQQHKMILLEYVQSNYFLSVILFTLFYIVLVALSVPGAVIATLAAGFLFGVIWGTVYVNIGATIGALLAFLVARYLFGNRIQEKYDGRFSKLNKELNEHGASYLIILRLMPVFPFFIVNIGAALTKISLFTFGWTTSLGIIPGSLVYAFAGSQLSTINSVKEILSGRVIVAFVVLAILSLVPMIYKRFCLKNN